MQHNSIHQSDHSEHSSSSFGRTSLFNSKMHIFACALLALFYVTVVVGETCRFNVPVSTSEMKCGDQIYHRSPEAIAAHNQCAEGKNGTEIPITHLHCMFEKLGVVKNGVKDIRVLAALVQKDFPQQYEPLLKGMKDCCDANPPEASLKDPLKHIGCLAQLYQDVCKHKSCDWMNTFD